MRKTLFVGLLAALAVALVPAATATPAKTVAVSITRTAFMPKNLTINVGDAVKWTNKDTLKHQVACAKCPFTSPVLNAGGTYSYTFTKAGKFAVHDPLHTKIKGTITVQAPKGVTLTATPGVTKYLQSTTLSGRISSGRSGQHVVILERGCGQTGFSTVETVTTSTNGTFSLSDIPKLKTEFKAKWNTVTSTLTQVLVRPRLRLAHLTGHKFRVKVKAARSFVGTRVIFQKKTATGSWVKVKRVTLKTQTIAGFTITSKSNFKSKIRHGKKVRILLKSKQAAPCYLGNHSNTVRS
jgi:plastocyanin